MLANNLNKRRTATWFISFFDPESAGQTFFEKSDGFLTATNLLSGLFHSDKLHIFAFPAKCNSIIKFWNFIGDYLTNFWFSVPSDRDDLLEQQLHAEKSLDTKECEDRKDTTAFNEPGGRSLRVFVPLDEAIEYWPEFNRSHSHPALKILDKLPETIKEVRECNDFKKN